MPVLLNPKHERFAQELAKGKAADESYALAGFSPNRGNASVLKHKQNILNRVSEILSERESVHAQSTADAIKSTSLTKEWVIEMLTQNVDRAMQATAVLGDDGEPIGEYSYQGSVANRSLELLGKELGMFIDRKEVRHGSFESMNADQLREYINRETAELSQSQVPAALTNGSGKPH